MSSVMGRLLGPRGKERAAALAEALWTIGFAALSPFVFRRAATWQRVPSHQRILIVAPHPDDEAIGCAGAILLHKHDGASVVVACATDGRTSGARGLGPDEMARRRHAEIDAAARLLGIDRVEWLGLRAGEWSEPELLEVLEQLMGEYRPDLVYAPSCVDFHPEHHRVAEVLGRFWSASQAPPSAVRIYPVQVPLTPALANVAVDVTPFIVRVRAAMHAYATQFANMARALRQRRYAARLHRLGEYVEEFWDLTPQEYAVLHEPSAREGRLSFRGLREQPWTDPLAYLSGHQTRRRLLRLVSSRRPPGIR